ncbi:MAG: hypothetical protein OEV94_02230 [Deltaproteobacteria bacterium]|nr:hypothetical protein [Deltaproteobacteria bacterium]
MLHRILAVLLATLLLATVSWAEPPRPLMEASLYVLTEAGPQELEGSPQLLFDSMNKGTWKNKGKTGWIYIIQKTDELTDEVMDLRFQLETLNDPQGHLMVTRLVIRGKESRGAEAYIALQYLMSNAQAYAKQNANQ